MTVTLTGAFYNDHLTGIGQYKRILLNNDYENVLIDTGIWEDNVLEEGISICNNHTFDNVDPVIEKKPYQKERYLLKSKDDSSKSYLWASSLQFRMGVFNKKVAYSNKENEAFCIDFKIASDDKKDFKYYNDLCLKNDWKLLFKNPNNLTIEIQNFILTIWKETVCFGRINYLKNKHEYIGELVDLKPNFKGIHIYHPNLQYSYLDGDK